MRLPSIILTVLACAILVSSQALSDYTRETFRAETKKSAILLSEPLVPGEQTLRILSLGNPSLAADILWLQTIQYFGSGNPYGSYPSLGPLLNTITALDPKFEGAYAFGLIVLPFMKQADASIALGERARQELPENGLLTYYLATNYHLNRKDYRKASELYRIAAGLPDSPTAAERLAGVTLAQLSDTLSDRLVALEFWKTVYEQSENPEEKERAENWFNHMQIVYALETAAVKYHEQQGKYPSSQADLIAVGLIPQEVLSPIERELEFNPETGRISFDKFRALE